LTNKSLQLSRKDPKLAYVKKPAAIRIQKIEEKDFNSLRENEDSYSSALCYWLLSFF